METPDFCDNVEIGCALDLCGPLIRSLTRNHLGDARLPLHPQLSLWKMLFTT